jgi:hypothetical protein
MARHFLFPDKDATIYENLGTFSRKFLNSGKDEMLQLDKQVLSGGQSSNSRILISFETTEIKNILDNVIGDNSFTASIRLYSSENYNLGQSQSIEVYPVAEFWQNGTGRAGDSPYKTDGVSWVYRTDDDLNQPWTTSSYIAGTTGSWDGTDIGGGVWYTQSAWYTSSEFNLADNLDLDLDVTETVRQFYSESINNYGFIIKRKNTQEQSSEELGTLNFFSRETHTIYTPQLEFKWDDSIYTTGSLTEVGEEFDLHLKNNKQIYNRNSKTKFRIHARNKFPTRGFVTESIYLTGNSIPSSSYYSIRDAYTEEIIVPFDEYSKISHDSESPYFFINFQGLQPERYYRILLKVELTDGRVEILDDGYIFKVVR